MRRRLVILLTAVIIVLSCTVPSFAAEKEKLRVALTGQFPPFSHYSKDGELIGFDVDVARLLAGEMGMEAEFTTIEWDGILAGLLSGKYDCIISSMAVTPEREKKVNFTKPYYYSGAQLFIHEKNKGKYKTPDDLKGRKVGVVLGETYEQYMRKYHPEVDIVTYMGTPFIFEEMASGRIEAFVTDRLVGMYQIKSAGKPFVPAGAFLYRETLAIPVVKENEELLAKLNTALDAIRKNGKLDEVHVKWFGAPPAEKPAGEGSSRPDIGGMGAGTIAKMIGKGFAVTLLIAIVSIVCGFVISLPVGILLHGKTSVAQKLARILVDFIRGTPVLIQLFFVYFGLPTLGVHIPPMLAAIVTLTINSAAYMSEIIRSGLMSVAPGQRLGSKALGFTRFQAFRYVIWPQAFRISLPTLVNSAVALLKDTALVSVIAVREVVMEAKSVIAVNFEAMLVYFIVLCIFFVFTYPLMILSGRIEARIKSKGFANA